MVVFHARENLLNYTYNEDYVTNDYAHNLLCFTTLRFKTNYHLPMIQKPAIVLLYGSNALRVQEL